MTEMRGGDGGREESRSGREQGRPLSTPYLGRHLLAAGLVLCPSLALGEVEGRLGVSACVRWWVVVMVGVLGAQVKLCKARGHAAGLAEGLGARDHGRRRRRRGGGAVATF